VQFIVTVDEYVEANIIFGRCNDVKSLMVNSVITSSTTATELYSQRRKRTRTGTSTEEVHSRRRIISEQGITEMKGVHCTVIWTARCKLITSTGPQSAKVTRDKAPIRQQVIKSPALWKGPKSDRCIAALHRLTFIQS